MGQTWYYSRGTDQFGPVSIDQLKELIANGQVQSASLVWTEGMTQWIPMSSVPELAATAPEAMAAPAPQAQPAYQAHPQQPAWQGQPQQPGWQPPGGPGQMLGYQSPMWNQVQYAGFWMRVASAIIDGLVMFIPGAIVGGIVGFIAGANGTTPNSLGWIYVNAFIQVLTTVMNWLYFALMESSATQGTLGKMAVGIKVTDMEGARVSFGRATGRYFGKIISAIILLVGYMMAGWTEKKQALHDIMAGTLVVKK